MPEPASPPTSIVIEDYPSHYSAYNRRKHRWLRGDWQIVEWLTDRVPDESGARVPNPISLISRWKILDNLRRSLVEPATFALLLFSWLVMDRPILWTLATICLLFVPAWVEFAFGLTRAIMARQLQVARAALSNLFASNFTVFLTLTLLAYQRLCYRSTPFACPGQASGDARTHARVGNCRRSRAG